MFKRTFESFGSRDFRFLWYGSVLGMGGFTMQMIARTILVDDLTGSAFLTGLVSMGFAPSMLILALFGGVAGDRIERRLLIQMTQIAHGVTALVVAILIITGAIHWGHLLAVSIFQGALFAFQMPARQAAIPYLVGKDQITNAVALGAAGMAAMSIFAPGIAGLLYGQLGPEAVYLLIVVTSALAALSTGQIPKIPPEPETGNVLQNVGAGIKYVGSNSTLILLLLSGLTVAILAMPIRTMMPVIARRLYGTQDVLVSGGTTFVLEPSHIGWLLTMAGVGGLLATIVIANLKRGQHRGLILLAGSVAMGLALSLIGLIPTYIVGLSAMLVVGFAESIRWALGMSLILESTSTTYRARVSSIQMMTYGLMPLGALPLGMVVDRFTARPAMLGVGIIVTIVGLGFLFYARTLRRLP